MMEDDREKIFASIRRGLRGIDKYLADRNPKSPLKSKPGIDFDSLFAKFKIELSTLGGEAVVAASEAEAAEFVASHTQQDSSIFIYEEIKNERKAFTGVLSGPRQSRFGSEFEAGYDKRELANFDSAVTACAACIAETGTVVMKTNMRLPAALAARLFMIVERQKLLPSLDELFNDTFGGFEGSNLFLITGPSRTADIEKQLVKGVHGPKEVFVIFLQQ